MPKNSSQEEQGAWDKALFHFPLIGRPERGKVLILDGIPFPGGSLRVADRNEVGLQFLYSFVLVSHFGPGTYRFS